jgi:hypothetical protein
VLTLAGDGYVEQATVRGDEMLTVVEPCPIAFCPTDLLHP